MNGDKCKGKSKPALLIPDHFSLSVITAGKKEKARPSDEVSPKADKKEKVEGHGVPQSWNTESHGVGTQTCPSVAEYHRGIFTL